MPCDSRIAHFLNVAHSNYIFFNPEGLEEMDLEEDCRDDDEAERGADEKIQLLEDRSRITKGIEQLQAKEVTAEEVTAEEVKAEPTFAEENREDSDEVHSFADLHRKLAALPSFGPKDFGESACLQRLVAMHDDIGKLCEGGEAQRRTFVKSHRDRREASKQPLE